MQAIAGIIRALFRLVGLIVTLAGLGALGLLVAVAAAGNGMISQPLGQVWFQNHVASLNLTQAIIQRRLLPELWDPGLVTALGWPSWMALSAFGVVFLLIGGILVSATRRRAR